MKLLILLAFGAISLAQSPSH
eukprot:CCRYP_010444-RF/>CCRYP_010444-RF protein AED:0.49 eAED:0.52 QI:0/-1/0/1/-1/0/1/0/20